MSRKSLASLAIPRVDGRPSRLSPPESLTESEAAVFRGIVAACAPEHFTRSDLPLLAQYSIACCQAETAAKEMRAGAVIDGKASPWLVVQEKSVRSMVALSMRLRVSPQSRVDPKTIGRSKSTPPSPYDYEEN